ncbi:MAG: PrgI family protein [bacterium]
MPAQYVVPQFIEVEDKIIGPISVRQFVELMVTAMILFILYSLLTFVTFLLIGIPIAGVGFILAFATINGQAFHLFLLNVVVTLKKPGLRVWYKELSNAELRDYIKKAPPPPPAEILSKERPAGSRLAELSLVVNTGGVYAGEDDGLDLNIDGKK